MDKLIFALCAATAFLCSYFLLRGYFRNKHRLLLWSGLCFIALTFSNLLIIADRWIFPSVDLSTTRLLAALVGIILLIYGLVWEND